MSVPEAVLEPPCRIQVPPRFSRFVHVAPSRLSFSTTVRSSGWRVDAARKLRSFAPRQDCSVLDRHRHARCLRSGRTSRRPRGSQERRGRAAERPTEIADHPEGELVKSPSKKAPELSTCPERTTGSNLRPSPWQGDGNRPPRPLQSAEQAPLRRAVRPVGPGPSGAESSTRQTVWEIMPPAPLG